ncbi:MAG: HlyD family efflux transporter periplasmic adaptor subunit [Planctomycetes bacterium]|nr:HlyD family efflux transporter periplasmic adaptor subunit [Planctomycetota bacterium]
MTPVSHNDPRRRRGIGTIGLILIGFLVLAIVSVTVFLRGGGSDDENGNGGDMFVATVGSFDITIPSSGDLAALKQTEIASQLEGRAVVTEIVEEGAMVKAGELLIALEDEDILTRIKDTRVSVMSAETAWETAKSNLEIRRDASASQLSLADVDIQLAELANEAWTKGKDVSTVSSLELEKETSWLNYKRLQERFDASMGLLEQKFISEDEYKIDEIEMKRAKQKYEEAVIAHDVYLKYERVEQRERLAADIQKARDGRKEIADRAENELRSLATDVDGKAASLERERDRLAKAEGQLEKCRIIAPQDGLVVYASSIRSGRHRWGNNDEQITIGTELRRNRTVMVLPDTSQMTAEVKVTEALSGKIRKGQRAVVYSDALPDTALAGEVLGVGVLAESGGWRDPNRRDYTVRVLLTDTNGHGLKPSMRCRASIYVGRVDDVLHVPVQAIFREGPVAFVYQPEGSGYVQQPVEVGRSSEMYIEILGGLAEGSSVLLREPPPERIIRRLDPETLQAKRPMAGRPKAGGPRGARAKGQRPGHGGGKDAAKAAPAGGGQSG